MRPLLLASLLAAGCSSSDATTSADAPARPDAPIVMIDAGPHIDARPTADAGPSGPDAMAPPYPTVTLAATPLATGLSQPVAILKPPGETRYFVAEKTGTVSIIGADMKPVTPAFIDISANLSMNDEHEEGLLALAFHPGYATNGRVFVYFTGKMTPSSDSDRNIHIWEFHRDASGNTATFAKEILAIDHSTQENDNGGQLLFGPVDHFLYISVGDGGGQFDAEMTGKDFTKRLAKILRIDVDHGDPYAAPADNPFSDMPSAAAKDTWAIGLRNPWRFSFDRQTHDVWIGDEGQNCWEELDLVPAGTSGANLAWSLVEGMNHCTDPAHGTCPTSTCMVSQAIVPVTEYDHGKGKAVVGGYVYRGSAIPEIQGMYFFSDQSAGFVRSFWAAFPVTFDMTMNWSDLAKPQVSTFDEDSDGELLYCSGAAAPDGACYKITKP